MDLELKNRVAVVTGGTSGVGLATVRLLLDEGARVAFCGRNEERLRSAESDLRKEFATGEMLAACCDVLDRDQVSAFAATVESTWGACDALVNNAGTARLSTFENTDDEAWMEETRLKLFGVIYPARAFLPLLENSGDGAIVNVNSLLALQPEPALVATSAARAGLLNLTKSMAREFAPKGIRVNSVLLGTIDSGQWRRRFRERAKNGESYEDFLAEHVARQGILMNRFGKPEEVANAIAFLASRAAGFTSGASIDVSGGIARHIG